MINILKNLYALQRARQLSATVMLCMLCVVFGCKENKDEQKMDEDTFLKNLESAPVVIVPKEDLPEWLNEWIDDLFKSYTENPISGTYAKVFRGEWDKKTVYYITHSHSSCVMCFYDEEGEHILLKDQGDVNKFYTLSKNWELIFEVINEFTSSKSKVYQAKIADKYEFPDISHLNDWFSEDITPLRFKALQLSDDILANISTAGLLDTCLDFPYLLNIIET